MEQFEYDTCSTSSSELSSSWLASTASALRRNIASFASSTTRVIATVKCAPRDLVDHVGSGCYSLGGISISLIEVGVGKWCDIGSRAISVWTGQLRPEHTIAEALGIARGLLATSVDLAKTVTCVGVALTLYNSDRTVWSAHLPEIVRTRLSRFIYRPDDYRAHVCREVFNEGCTEMKRDKKFHCHKEAASARNAGDMFIEELALNLGKQIYCLQKAKRDERRGFQGSRSIHMARDVNIQPEVIDIDTDRHLVSVIDTDHYIQINEHLARNPALTAIAGWQPSDVAFTGPVSMTFIGNKARFLVPGGEQHEHELWCYDKSTYTLIDWKWGLPQKFVVFQTERRHITDHYAVTFLIPVAVYTTWRDILTAWVLLGVNRVQRYNVKQGEYSRMEVVAAAGYDTPAEHYTSTGLAGTYASVRVPVATESVAIAAFNTHKTNLTPFSVRSMFEDHKLKVADGAFRIYYGWLMTQKFSTDNPARTFVIKPYFLAQFGEPNEYAKPFLVPFMNPILAGETVVHSKTTAAYKTAVNVRIVQPRNGKSPSAFVNICITDFVAHLAELTLDGGPLLRPLSFEEIVKSQPRPSQQLILAQAFADRYPGWEKERQLGVFIKADAQRKIDAARIITTVNGGVKAVYSTYTRRIAEQFKAIDKRRMEWYAFGNDGNKVSETLVRLAANALALVLTDFAKYDGTVGEALRILERKYVLAIIHPDHHSEVLLMLSKQQEQVCGFSRADPMECVVKYFSGLARLSGSPETSLFNSINNLFVNYYAVRTLWKEPGVRYTSTEAWNWVTTRGIYGGDDGVIADVPVKALNTAAEHLGLSIKPEAVTRGKPFVNFLARYYTSELWYGNGTSCCDIRRQLAKLHMANGRVDVTPLQKLKDKLIGYALSDANTPVIGKLAIKGLRLLSGVETAGVYVSWSTSGGKDNQYPNEFHEDFVRLAEMQMPTFDFQSFEDWVEVVDTAEALLIAPSFMGEILPLKNAVVGVRNNIDAPQESPPEAPVGVQLDVPVVHVSMENLDKVMQQIDKPKPPPGKPLTAKVENGAQAKGAKAPTGNRPVLRNKRGRPPGDKPKAGRRKE